MHYSGDEVHKHAEINNTLAIYANKLVNITTAQGHDADGALYGLSGISRPRSPTRQCTRQ